MRRREFCGSIGALIASPSALGQSAGPVRRIAILELGDRQLRAELWGTFERRLRELGYVEGGNLRIDRRWADGAEARLPPLAQELLDGKPEVLLAATTPATQVLMRLTDSLPIIFVGAADPVGTGLVASLARPGRNVTGFSTQLTDVNEKRLDLLREILPAAKRFVLLGPGNNKGVEAVLKRLQEAARLRGLAVRLVDARDAATVARAFEGLAAEQVDALLVAQVMLQHHRQIVELAARSRIPAAYVDKQILEAGGLLVFGPERDATYRHAADYVHRLLQGAKPADLPVMQPTEFWLGVNLRTARDLGLKISHSMLVRANRVIE